MWRAVRSVEDGAPVAGGGGPIAYVEGSAPTRGSLGHAELAAD
jgi:hypothetical protein